MRVTRPRHAATTDDTLLPFDLPDVRRKKLTVDFADGNQSSDAGLLLLREAERRLGAWRRPSSRQFVSASSRSARV